MAKPFKLPSRQIHLDFHTGPAIPDVGADFDAREFAATMKRAHVDSVTLFAKCHHGHLYYDSRRPERHPGMKRGLDLLRAQVDALRRVGIRTPLYLSVQCDEYAANTHPEWICLQPDGKPVGPEPFKAGWQILDMNSPYQDYLAEQTAELLRLFKPVDGVFFDMCWDQPSCSTWAIAAMERKGLDPLSEADRKRHAHELAIAYMKRFHRQVKAANRAATVYFNSRPLANLAEEIPYLGQVEIEALPTGGWGYLYFPKNVRFARTFGREYLGMTARFHKSWADFGGLKPYAALEYETSQMVAHGAKCSIGDQLHPRGVLDRGAYELIGRVYGRIAEREPWLDGAVPQAQIGLFQTTPATSYAQNASGADEGATRMLTQLRHQFDVVDERSDWGRYGLLVLPDAVEVGPPLAKRLTAYLASGGKLLASGRSGLDATGTKVLVPRLGITAHGESPFTTTYLRFGKPVAAGVPDSDHVMYERGLRVTATKGSRAVVAVVEPYFERAWNHFCSHFQTPGDRASRYAAATLNRKAAYIAYPIFSAFANHGNYPYRLLVRNLLGHLLPTPLLIVDGPTSLEATVMRQPSQRRTIVHLLHYAPERRAPGLDIVEDIVPLHDVHLSLSCARRPRQVYLAPERMALSADWSEGRLTVTVPRVDGHAMVVVE